jgi:hypothetical protein
VKLGGFVPRDPVLCPKCGAESNLVRMRSEIASVGILNPKVNFVARNFDFSCPKCGHSFIETRRVGYHATIATKELKDRFPKKYWKQLRAALPVEERKIFRQTLSGKRMALDGEVERWLKVLEQIQQ